MIFSILIASDASHRGERYDHSGEVIFNILSGAGHTCCEKSILPDDRKLIAQQLQEWCDLDKVDVIITSGGTGLSERDVTPDATGDICNYEVPGIPEAMRAETVKFTPHALLSRAKAAVRGKTLIVNLPGSPKGVKETLNVIIDILPHAVEILRGKHSTLHK